MQDEDRRETDISTLEKHGQTLIASAILISMTWMGSVLMNTNTDIKVLAEKVAGIERQMVAASVDRYTSKDAEASQRTANQRFSSIEYRLKKLESK